MVYAIAQVALADDLELPVGDRPAVDAVQQGVEPGEPRRSRPGWFTMGYFHRPDEVRAEVITAGFGGVEVVAVEGVAALREIEASLDARAGGKPYSEPSAASKPIRRCSGPPGT